MNRSLQFQQLMDFTVKVLHPETKNYLLGTGFVVSTKGEIVTCAHVVKKGGIDPKDHHGKKIKIYFSSVKNPTGREREAVVKACLSDYDDDVVLLQLSDGPLPLGPEQIAILGDASQSLGHKFISFGYRQLGKYLELPAEGNIVGPGGILENRLKKPLVICSRYIDRGMSGAAVMDTSNSLIVGIISETWENPQSHKDDYTSFAVDSSILKAEPFMLPVLDSPIEVEPGSSEKAYIKQQRAEVMDASEGHDALTIRTELSNAPPLLDEWVAREELMKALESDWDKGDLNVVGLIGFDGEGKTSLVRQWTDNLVKGKYSRRPRSLFWWSFSDSSSLDQFFESVLATMAEGFDVKEMVSSNLRWPFISNFLKTECCLFILDSLDVLQYQSGDEYGTLRNSDIRRFIELLMNQDNDSFCVITSRIPLLDFIKYRSFKQREVGNFTNEEGISLLKNLNVNLPHETMKKIIAECNGHALTLSLMPSYLSGLSESDLQRGEESILPKELESANEPIQRLLLSYDKNLNNDERAIIMLLAAFRLPIKEAFSIDMFSIMSDNDLKTLNAKLGDNINREHIKYIFESLSKYRLIKYDSLNNHFTLHPLVRSYYRKLLAENEYKDLRDELHFLIFAWYMLQYQTATRERSLEGLRPLIEAMHHACGAGRFSNAWDIYISKINNSKDYLLTDQLGAYETALSLIRDFFIDRDIHKDLLIPASVEGGTILGNAGFFLMCLGRLYEALALFNREKDASKISCQKIRLSNGYQNLTRLNIMLGDLSFATIAARKGIHAARSSHASGIKKKEHSINTFCLLGRALYLRGFLNAARDLFIKASASNAELGKVNFLTKYRGIYYAEFLLRLGETDEAMVIARANMGLSRRKNELGHISRCHRLIGDIFTRLGEIKKAFRHYDRSLKLSELVMRRELLIEGLLARGKLKARHSDNPKSALEDLNVALEQAKDYGYRLYEADARIALAWVYRRMDDESTARAQAEHARQMSLQMEYYWGKVDADEFLNKNKA